MFGNFGVESRFWTYIKLEPFLSVLVLFGGLWHILRFLDFCGDLIRFGGNPLFFLIRFGGDTFWGYIGRFWGF